MPRTHARDTTTVLDKLVTYQTNLTSASALPEDIQPEYFYQPNKNNTVATTARTC
jgi:hypothetical protein